MVAQSRRELMRPLARRRKRRTGTNLLRGLIRNQMACVLLLAVAVLLLLIPYASAYARVTQKGYHRAELLTRLRDMRLENESLRLRLEGLRQPERIAVFALANGMEHGESVAYLRPTNRPRLAQNTEHGDVR